MNKLSRRGLITTLSKSLACVPFLSTLPMLAETSLLSSSINSASSPKTFLFASENFGKDSLETSLLAELMKTSGGRTKLCVALGPSLKRRLLKKLLAANKTVGTTLSHHKSVKPSNYITDTYISKDRIEAKDFEFLGLLLNAANSTMALQLVQSDDISLGKYTVALEENDSHFKFTLQLEVIDSRILGNS